jgi:hypothetical protein
MKQSLTSTRLVNTVAAAAVVVAAVVVVVVAAVVVVAVDCRNSDLHSKGQDYCSKGLRRRREDYWEGRIDSNHNYSHCPMDYSTIDNSNPRLPSVIPNLQTLR